LELHSESSVHGEPLGSLSATLSESEIVSTSGDSCVGASVELSAASSAPLLAGTSFEA
jgi:hypothetical protein